MSQSSPTFRVFLSYRRSDVAAEQRIGWMFRALEDEFGRGTVYWDRVSNGPGPFAPTVDAALKSAEVVVVVIGDLARWLGCRNSSAPGNRGPEPLPLDWLEERIACVPEHAEQAFPGLLDDCRAILEHLRCGETVEARNVAVRWIEGEGGVLEALGSPGESEPSCTGVCARIEALRAGGKLPASLASAFHLLGIHSHQAAGRPGVKALDRLEPSLGLAFLIRFLTWHLMEKPGLIPVVADHEDARFARRIDHPEDWVRREVAQALHEAALDPRKLIVPFVLTKGSLPDRKVLPAGLEDLVAPQAYIVERPTYGPEDGVDGFLRWLRPLLNKSPQRRVLLQRLKDPLSYVEKRAPLLQPGVAERLHVLYRAARGIVVKGEDTDPPALTASVEEILDALDRLGGNEPLLRFLCLVLFREDGMVPPTSGLRDAWVEEINLATREPKEAGWELNSGCDKVQRWAQTAPLRPLFQLIFTVRPSDKGHGTVLEAEGSKWFGGRMGRLEMESCRFPWREGMEDAELLRGLGSVFRKIRDDCDTWLGADPVLWAADLTPRVEIFLRREQYRWPVDLTPLEDTLVGAVFQVVRRLFERYFGAGKSMHYNGTLTAHGQRIKATVNIVPKDQIFVAPDWNSLRGLRRPVAAFVVPEAIPRDFDEIIERHACGLWFQPGRLAVEGTSPDAEELAEALASDTDTAEQVRCNRTWADPSWTPVALLHDHPDHPVPTFRDQAAERAPVSTPYSLLQ